MNSVVLQYTSDFHLEARRKWPMIPCHAPVLLLAGDMGNPKRGVMAEFFADVAGRFHRIVYTPGNHEYFGNTLNETDKALRVMLDRFPNVTLLQNEDTLIEDIYENPLRIVGSTLWAPCPTEVRDLRDFRKIFVGNPVRRFRPEDMQEMYGRNVNYLKAALCEQQEVDTVVLTHHGPMRETNGPFMNHRASAAYASDLRHLMHDHVRAWVYGHTHQNMTLKHNQCTVATNALGYPGERVLNFRSVALLEF